MANDLPSNLDDGELWLPSDVIRAVGVCRHDHHRVPNRLPAFPTDFASIDTLSQKLAAFSLLERRHRAIQRFSQIPEFQFSSPAYIGYKAPAGRRVTGTTGGTGAFFPVSRGVHKYHPGIPVDGVQSQCGGSLNRYLPTRGLSSGRESGGTGVFLPRTVAVDSRKKPQNRFVDVSQGQWNPMPGKPEAKFVPPSEMFLPNDWTY